MGDTDSSAVVYGGVDTGFLCDPKPVKLGLVERIRGCFKQTNVSDLASGEESFYLDCEAEDLLDDGLVATLEHALCIYDDYESEDDVEERLDECSEDDDSSVLSLQQTPQNDITGTNATCYKDQAVPADHNEVKVLLPGDAAGCGNANKGVISAMKGSRAQRGIVLESQLHVKWAPDVYDPPVTSDSHTVKGGYRLRARPSKKDYHKHRQSKSSRSSSHGRNDRHDKKHAHSSSSRGSSRGGSSSGGSSRKNIYPCSPRLYEKSVLHDPTVHIVEPVKPVPPKVNELSCGSSCRMEPLTALHLPLGEAS